MTLRLRPAAVAATLFAALWTARLPAEENRLVYPQTRREELVEELHGVQVADPYRWLEQDVRESSEVAAWVEEQNKVTFGYLEQIPEREAIRARLTEIWDYERFSAPFKEGGRYYFYKNDGLQNQAVLYVQETLEAEPQVLIDPNTWSADGTVALGTTSFSDDGRWVAYAVREAGSDWQTYRVMDVATRRVLEDEVKWVKFSDASWTLDGRGFFYGRYDEPAEGEEFTSLNLGQKVYYHRVGTPQAEDVLVYYRPDQPEWGYDATVTEDGRYLILTVWKGTDAKYRVLVKDLAEPFGMPEELIGEFENEYSFVGNDGPTLYFLTDLEAPRRRLLAIDLRHPQREAWRTIVPQREETLEGISFVGNQFVAQYLRDAASQIVLFDQRGEPLREIELPGLGSADGFGGKRTDTETFYVFSSYATPASIYRYDLLTGESKLLRRAGVDFDGEKYEVQQVFYQSRDGTRVPLFITHRKGIKLDGSHATLLYGYGGFAASMNPAFSIVVASWLELGGVYAVANLRGGGEYGEEWHQAGVKARKQNVFDDFIAAAEWLVQNKYTRRDKLAIQGGSNGGLLIGAAMTQRPELFGACLPAVGVMDMLRFHKFTAGRFWVDDYGSPDVAEDFPALLAYSPYHNLRPGTAYPPTLVTTADTDDRVVPGHSFKFAAALQQAQAGAAPVLIRIETRAGHGGGKPTAKIIEETADEWAFLVKTLGMKLPAR